MTDQTQLPFFSAGRDLPLFSDPAPTTEEVEESGFPQSHSEVPPASCECCLERPATGEYYGAPLCDQCYREQAAITEPILAARFPDLTVCTCTHPPHEETRQCQYDKALAALELRREAGDIGPKGYTCDRINLDADYPECVARPEFSDDEPPIYDMTTGAATKHHPNVGS